MTVLERCKEGLKPGGCIVIKDNVSSKDPVLDEDDSSVTRCFFMFLEGVSNSFLKKYHLAPFVSYPCYHKTLFGRRFNVL